MQAHLVVPDQGPRHCHANALDQVADHVHHRAPQVDVAPVVAARRAVAVAMAVVVVVTVVVAVIVVAAAPAAVAVVGVALPLPLLLIRGVAVPLLPMVTVCVAVVVPPVPRLHIPLSMPVAAVAATDVAAPCIRRGALLAQRALRDCVQLRRPAHAVAARAGAVVLVPVGVAVRVGVVVVVGVPVVVVVAPQDPHQQQVDTHPGHGEDEHDCSAARAAGWQ